MKGFFYSYELGKLITKLSELLKMRRATNNEYKSFSSCWYFLKNNEDGSKDLRFKIYNKLM